MHTLIALIATASAFLIYPESPGPPPREPETVFPDSRLAARRTPVVDVFESNRDAVVNISSKETIVVRDQFFDSIFEDFFDMPGRPRGFGPREREVTRTSVGSGFVIHPDGYIVTNAHVVAQTAERKAIFSDGREFVAEIIASDPRRDLAILKINASDSLPTIRLGRSDDLLIGETVIAIGNPLGYQNTVTAGVVSAVDRELPIARDLALTGLIQTDASINPGNSGGPLLNVLGELIGVNTAIRGDAQNIGFAIPVDQLREVLPELLDIERRYRLITGLTVGNIDSPSVTIVQPDSPAAEAGVRVGDVLCSIDDRPIGQGVDFYIALIGRKPGDIIDLDLMRDGKPIAAKVKLKGKPAPDGAALAREKLGLEVDELTEEVAEHLGLPGVRGLIVTEIEPDGPADSLGLQRRDVIVALAGSSLSPLGRGQSERNSPSPSGRGQVAPGDSLRRGEGVPRNSTRSVSPVSSTVSSIEELGLLLEYVTPNEPLRVTVLRIDRRAKYKLTGELTAR